MVPRARSMNSGLVCAVCEGTVCFQMSTKIGECDWGMKIKSQGIRDAE